MFSIDGVEFDIPVVSLERQAPVLDKFANRTEDGNLHRKIIGVYYNYTLSFPNLNLNREEYAALWDKVTEAVEFHDFVVPWSTGTYSFKGYIKVAGDRLIKAKDGKHYWGGLSIELIAQAPARLPGE